MPNRSFVRNLAKDHGAPKAMAVAAVLMVLLIHAGCQEAPDAPLLPKQPTQAELDYQAGRVPGEASTEPSASGFGLPRLVALGAGKCVPCKQMQPDLAELREHYAGAMELVYIDVWEDREAGARYGIQSIPTQIFYDPSGKELFRHVGYYSKDDILSKWEELGMPLQPSEGAPTPEAS